MRQRFISSVAISIPLLAVTLASASPPAVPGHVDSAPQEGRRIAGFPELNGPVAPPAVGPSVTDIEKSRGEPLNVVEPLNKGLDPDSAAQSGAEDESARPKRTIASSTAPTQRRSSRRRPPWRSTRADAAAPEPPVLVNPRLATAEPTASKKLQSSSAVDQVELAEPRGAEPGLLPIQKNAARELQARRDVGALLSNPRPTEETPRLESPKRSRQDATQEGDLPGPKQSLESPKTDDGVRKFVQRESFMPRNDPHSRPQGVEHNAEHDEAASSGHPLRGQASPEKPAGSPPSLNSPPRRESDTLGESTGNTTPSASMGIELTQPRLEVPPASNRDHDGTKQSRDADAEDADARGAEDIGALLQPSAPESRAEVSGKPQPRRHLQPGTHQGPTAGQVPEPNAKGEVAEDGDQGKDGHEVGDGRAVEEEPKREAGQEDAPRPAKQEQASPDNAEAEIAPDAEQPETGQPEAEELAPQEVDRQAGAGARGQLREEARSSDGIGKRAGDRLPEEAPKPLSPQLLQLRDRVRTCLTDYYQRPASVREHSPWGIMHDVFAYGVDTEVRVGRDRVNAIGWLCYNRPCRGLKLFQFDGRYPVPREGPGYQGHKGQVLSMLALSRVKSTYPLRVEGHELTVQDLIEYEKATCRSKTELTFKLIGLAHYLPSNSTWRSKWGRAWSIPRLLQEELAEPINGAACGGTHRLMGYSMAVKTRLKRGEPLEGQWLRAHQYVDAYHKHVIKLQNRDGSFSTNWFKSRGAKRDLDRRVQTTGHILEWLVFSLPEDELIDPRIVRAVTYLNTVMLKYRRKDWESGHRGHALRALALYSERVFGDKPGERRDLLAHGSVK